MGLPAGARIWLVAGATDMRRGFDGLSAQVATTLEADPFSGHLFVFRGRRGDRVKILWWDGDGLCLFYKRLESGRFIWPQAVAFAPDGPHIGPICPSAAPKDCILVWVRIRPTLAQALQLEPPG